MADDNKDLKAGHPPAGMFSVNYRYFINAFSIA